MLGSLSLASSGFSPVPHSSPLVLVHLYLCLGLSQPWIWAVFFLLGFFHIVVWIWDLWLLHPKIFPVLFLYSLFVFESILSNCHFSIHLKFQPGFHIIYQRMVIWKNLLLDMSLVSISKALDVIFCLCLCCPMPKFLLWSVFQFRNSTANLSLGHFLKMFDTLTLNVTWYSLHQISSSIPTLCSLVAASISTQRTLLEQKKWHWGLPVPSKVECLQQSQYLTG